MLQYMMMNYLRKFRYFSFNYRLEWLTTEVHFSRFRAMHAPGHNAVIYVSLLDAICIRYDLFIGPLGNRSEAFN